MTLVEFLEARIADDERYYSTRHIHRSRCVLPDGCICTGGLGVRLRAGLWDCEAKRALIAFTRDEPTRWYFLLAPFAAVYRDHPDYARVGLDG